MPFSVTNYIADAEGTIVSLNWVYANDEGQINNQHRLAQPAGTVPMKDAGPDVLVGWLEDQLGNTAEDFDKAISQYKAAAEYNAGCASYALNEDTGKYEAPEPEPEVSNKLPQPVPPRRPGGGQAQAMDL